MTTEHPLVLREVQDEVVILTLNRADKANALSGALLEQLEIHLADLEASKARAVILTGAGTKAFCAGADLKERKTMDEEQVRHAVAQIRRVVNALSLLPMPVIAAINGVAFGGGTELALAADIRIAAASAQFGLTETSLAIIPGAGGTQRLTRLVGMAKAKELIFTAQRMDATSALAIGLVNQVVADQDLFSSATNMALEIARNGPVAVRQAKLAIDQGMLVDLWAGLSIEETAYEVVISTQDRLEGLQAFAEKRPPNYQGR